MSSHYHYAATYQKSRPGNKSAQNQKVQREAGVLWAWIYLPPHGVPSRISLKTLEGHTKLVLDSALYSHDLFKGSTRDFLSLLCYYSISSP